MNTNTPSEGQRIFDEWKHQSDAWMRNRGCNPMDDGTAPSLPEMIDLALAKARKPDNIICCWCHHETPLNQEREKLIEAMTAHMLDCEKSPFAAAVKACSMARPIVAAYCDTLAETCPLFAVDALKALDNVLGTKDRKADGTEKVF